MALKDKKIKKKLSAIRAAVYVRYSDRKQDGSFSIEYQVEECERHITNKGYSLQKFYIDKAKTGKKVAGRDEFDQMCRDAKAGKIDVIVVFSLSRSFRNVREALNFCHEMQTEHDIYIESVIEPIDMTSPHGKFSSTNLFAMHELQSDITANHVKAGMHIGARQGYYLGGYVPFGYTTYGTGEFARGKEKRKYKAHEQEAKIVKKFFELYADGFSLTFLQDYCIENRIYGRKGKIMSKQTIARILHNDFYIGTRRFDIDGYETVVVPKIIPAIIDDSLWARVQKRHAEELNKTAPRKTKRLYELTGKIICDKCEGFYTGEYKNDKRYPTSSAARYVCSTKKGHRMCDAKNIRKDVLDKFVIRSIKQHILDEQALESIADHIAKLAGNDPTNLQAEIKSKQKEKAALIKMEKELTLKELRGEISKETFLELKSDFTAQIADLNLELMRLDGATESAITKESVLQYLNDILLNIDTADPAILKNIFDKVVDRIIVADDRVEVHLIVSPLSLPTSEHKDSSGHPHYAVCSESSIDDLKR